MKAPPELHTTNAGAAVRMCEAPATGRNPSQPRSMISDGAVASVPTPAVAEPRARLRPCAMDRRDVLSTNIGVPVRNRPQRTAYRIDRSTIAAFVAMLLLLIAWPASAEAHIVTPPQCRQYGALHHLTTGANARTATRRCPKAAATHNAVHSCDTASGMRWATCAGLVAAALHDRTIPDSWPSNWALHELLRRESGWNPNAINASSGACGLFQRLPCPWPVSPGRVHATVQVEAANGFRYVLVRYGSPSAALAFHNAAGWY